MEDVLRMRIGDLKEEAADLAEFLGVSLSALARLSLREKIEINREQLEAWRKNRQQAQAGGAGQQAARVQ